MMNINDLPPLVAELCALTDNMYRLGWDERNGGNISCMLDDAAAFAGARPKRIFNIDFDASELAGRLFLVTGTGSYFRRISGRPQSDLGIVRIAPDGRSAGLLWGFENGGAPTSEFPTHLMAHAVRLRADPAHRVVMHTHPVNLLSMSFTHTLDEKEFTLSLWRTCTECVIVFPDGVSVLPWMLCGNGEIGEATAAKLRDSRLVLWAQHGIFGTGADLDTAFGLIETAEKAAEIYLKTAGHKILQTITDEQLRMIADAYGVTPRSGYIG